MIAELAAALPDLSDDQLTERCLILAGRLAQDAGRTARANGVVAAGWANHYLRHVAPRDGRWRLLAAELDVGTGRVDLSYEHVDGRIFFDEVKTGYATRSVVDARWIEQALRYAEAGQQRWEARFAGVRIVPIGSTHLISLVQTGRVPLRLRPTSSDPLRPWS